MMDKPPWVVEAQEFIDREWRLHLHETEAHEGRDDWKRYELTLHRSDGGLQVYHCECRYCPDSTQEMMNRD